MSEEIIDDLSWNDSDNEGVNDYSELDLDLKLKKLELEKVEIKQEIINLEKIRKKMRDEYRNIINKKIDHFIAIMSKIEIKFAMATQYLISKNIYEDTQTLFRNNITKNDTEEEIMLKIIDIALNKGWTENN